ncbi:MAG TPA: pilus assembly protein TadE [Planctomycetaceae bacterium]|nr:pilus assembly protein TadE [Planctomycetaceae bacterium]
MISNRKRTTRKGFSSMELALTLPILMLLLFGLFEFSMLFFARGTVVEASRVGARAATYPGTTEEFIQESVMQSLGPKMARNAVVKAEMGKYAGDPCVVVVKVPMGVASPDLLWPVGFSLSDQYLIAETVMQKE